MKSRLWLNLALLVFVVLLVIIIVKKPGIEPDTEYPALTRIKIEDIKHVYIQRQHGKDIEFKNNAGHWWIVQPVKMPADNFSVNALLNLVKTSVFSEHDLQLLDPATYGLTPPRAMITFNHKTRISFGASEPLYKRRYLSIANTLYTTNDLFYYQLASDIKRFLDPRLLPPESNIKRLVLPEMKLARVDGSWFRQPVNNKISADADVELIDTWQNTTALDIQIYNTFRQLKENVTVYLEGETTPISFNYQQDHDNFYLTRLDNGIRYTLPADIAVRLALHHVMNKNVSATNSEHGVK